MSLFEGKVALVTGGGSGIGEAACYLYGREAEEVAELVIWLSSEKASFGMGACYPIDGGYLAR